VKSSLAWWDRANSIMCAVAVVAGLGGVAFLEHQGRNIEESTQSQTFGSTAIAASVVWQEGKPCCSTCGAELTKDWPYGRCCGHSWQWTTAKCDVCAGCGQVSCARGCPLSTCSCASGKIPCPACGGDGVLGN